MYKPYKIKKTKLGTVGVLEYEDTLVSAYGGLLGVGKRLKEDANLANGAYHNGFAAACSMLGDAGQRLYEEFLNSKE